MDIKRYVEERLIKQRNWYEEKATYNKKLFIRYQQTVIILGALIPVMVGVLEVLEYSRYSGPISACISAIIAIVAGFDKLSNPHTAWYNYRANEELLKKEEYLYEFRVGPYEDQDEEVASKMLVERVERFISADIANFISSQKQKERHGHHANIPIAPEPPEDSDQKRE